MMIILIAISTNGPIVEVHEFSGPIIVFTHILRKRYESVRIAVLCAQNQNEGHVKQPDN
jgi:hypothetical protein